MACNQVGGLSGAFIPVSEDEGMIAAVQDGSLNLETRSHGYLFSWAGYDCHSGRLAC